MLKWPRVMISIGLLVGQGLLLATPALANTYSYQGVYVAIEQVLAVPSQNGNTPTCAPDGECPQYYGTPARHHI